MKLESSPICSIHIFRYGMLGIDPPPIEEHVQRQFHDMANRDNRVGRIYLFASITSDLRTKTLLSAFYLEVYKTNGA